MGGHDGEVIALAVASSWHGQAVVTLRGGASGSQATARPEAAMARHVRQRVHAQPT